MTLRSIPNGLSTRAPLDGGANAQACGHASPRYLLLFFFFGRVAPPRPRSVTPVSDSTRCTKPYERPVDSARARMLAPFSYFFFRSVASFSRCAPVMRAPFFRSATVAVPSRSLNCLVRADEGPGAAIIVHRWGGDQEIFSKIGERFRQMDHIPRWSLPPIDHRPVTAGDSGTPGGRRRSTSPRRSAPRPTTRPAAVSARAVQRPRPGPPPPDRRAHRPPGANVLWTPAGRGGYDGDRAWPARRRWVRGHTNPRPGSTGVSLAMFHSRRDRNIDVAPERQGSWHTRGVWLNWWSRRCPKNRRL